MNEQKFLLGLDLGTNSIGWCLTDENNNLVRRQGKSLWGVRLFEDAEDASGRRMNRGSRRRYSRRKERISLLQTLFADEMYKIDKSFFQRMELSKYHYEDRNSYFDTKQTLFIDKEYNDKDFYKQFPTIYHLRNHLIKSNQKEDLRFIYLALHHMIKYRGNFFSEGRVFKPMDQSEFKEYFEELNIILEELEIETINIIPDQFDEKFSKLKNDIVKAYGLTGIKECLKSFFNNKDKYFNDVIIGLIAGSDVQIKKIFDEDYSDSLGFKSISVKSADFDEHFESCKTIIDDESKINLIEVCKRMSDFLTIGNLLKGKKYLSEAMVARYDEHHDDLAKLKAFIKEKDVVLYKRVFSTVIDKVNNYPSYIGSNKLKYKKGERFKKCSQSEFYSFIKETLKKFDQEDPFVKKVLTKIADKNYLLRLNSSENGVLPYQLNEMEINEILKNQSAFYPFLLKKDQDNLSVADKILSLLKYKIPYYVGPLAYSKNGNNFSWVVRTSEKIYPWNFDKVVNKEETAKKFIERMLNKCSYLKDQYCLPKHSIVFSYYMVLSELNKICIEGNPISYEDKISIIKDLYLKKNVSKKDLVNYFNAKYKRDDNKKIVISTTNDKEIEEIHANMKSYRFFASILGDQYIKENIDKIENIIRDMTIFEDRSILESRLEKEYGINKKDIIKKIISQNYQGYGRISKKLLVELKVDVLNEHTGEMGMSILDIMQNTNYNLMEILDVNRYNFKAVIENYNKQFGGIKVDENFEIEDYVNDLYASPMMKRSLIQAYKIIKELEKIVNHPIDEFYIECGRSNQQKKNRTNSRKIKLQNMYNEAIKLCKDEKIKQELKEKSNELAEISDEGYFRSDKLYLYFTQLGRSMYSLRPMSLSDLSDYDIDHIVPQSKIKDDSIENRVLVYKNENSSKSDAYPIPQNLLNKDAKSFYKKLFDLKLIGSKKYGNILRTSEISEDELKVFLKRQIVANDQSVSALIKLIGELFTTENHKPRIIPSKAENVSDFRRKFELVKARDANNYHHAHDAYLNIVVGRTIDSYFQFFLYDNEYRDSKERNKTYNLIKIFEKTEFRFKPILALDKKTIVWDYDKTLAQIKDQIYNHFDIFCTTRTFVRNGFFNKVSINTAKESKGDNLLPLKNPSNNDSIVSKLRDTKKYGGYNDFIAGFYCLVKTIDKKGNEIITLETMDNIFIDSKATIEEKKKYLVERKGLVNPEILVPIVKVNTVIKRNNSKYCITGKTGAQFVIKNIIENNVTYNDLLIIKKISKFVDNSKKFKVNLYKLEDNSVIDEMPIIKDRIFVAPNKNKNTTEIILSNDELNSLFEKLRDSLNKKVYQSISGMMVYKDNLSKEEVINKFYSLSLYKKVVIVYEILGFLKCDRTISNLSYIGLSKSAGSLLISNKISEDQEIIAESITGFYKKILYKKRKK